MIDQNHRTEARLPVPAHSGHKDLVGRREGSLSSGGGSSPGLAGWALGREGCYSLQLECSLAEKYGV